MMAGLSRREKLSAEPKITPGKRKLLQHSACLWSILTRVNVLPPRLKYTIHINIITIAINFVVVSRGQHNIYTYMYYYKSTEKKKCNVHDIKYIKFTSRPNWLFRELNSQHHNNDLHAHYTSNGYMLDARTIDHTQDRILRCINARITMTVFVYLDNGVFGGNKK